MEYDGPEIKITKDRISFLAAYSQLIKRMLLPVGADSRIDSRTITDKLDEILISLPQVESGEVHTANDSTSAYSPQADSQSNPDAITNTEAAEQNESDKPPKKDLKNDPNRTRLILECYELHTDNYRLSDLFNELKVIPLKYKNSVAASIRIFLDLAVLTYIETENLEAAMQAKYKLALRQITLSKRIEFLKDKLNQKSSTIAQKLLNSENELSLDVLNGYVHNNDAHYLDATFINRFWDFLFPIFQELLDIKEV